MLGKPESGEKTKKTYSLCQTLVSDWRGRETEIHFWVDVSGIKMRPFKNPRAPEMVFASVCEEIGEEFRLGNFNDRSLRKLAREVGGRRPYIPSLDIIRTIPSPEYVGRGMNRPVSFKQLEKFRKYLVRYS